MTTKKPVISSLAAQLTRRTEQTEASALLWAMSVEERVVAMRNGTLSFAQCMEWARRAPRQIPLLDGEWEFIARDTPEVAEQRIVEGDSAPMSTTHDPAPGAFSAHLRVSRPRRA